MKKMKMITNASKQQQGKILEVCLETAPLCFRKGLCLVFDGRSCLWHHMDYFMYSTNEEFQTLASATITSGYFIEYKKKKKKLNARETCHSFCFVFIDVFCIMINKDF